MLALELQSSSALEVFVLWQLSQQGWSGNSNPQEGCCGEGSWRALGPTWLKWSRGRGQKRLQRMITRLTQFVQMNKVIDSLCFAGCSEITCPAAGGWESRFSPALRMPSSGRIHTARCSWGRAADALQSRHMQSLLAHGKWCGMMRDKNSCRCQTWGKLVLQKKLPL